MPGNRAPLLNKMVWLCWHQLIEARPLASCSGNASTHSSIAPSTTLADCSRMVPRMATGNQTHGSLPWRGASLSSSEPTAFSKLRQRVFPRSNVRTFCGISNSLRSRVPSFVKNPGTIADKATLLGWNIFLTKLSMERAGIATFGDAVSRQQDGLKMGAVARIVSAGWGCGHPSKGYQCSPAMKDSSARASLRSKEGTFTNIARLRAGAVDSEGVENLAVAPVEAIIPKVPVQDGSLHARFLDSGATPESRLIHETAIVHADALIGEGVQVGAFCTVGPYVKLGKGCILQPSCHILGDTQLGDNCVLSTGAVVGADIPGKTIIGDNNAIGHYAVVGVKCQDLKYKEGDECFLYIGNNNDIREFASIHRSSKPNDTTVLGNDNLVMGSCHVGHDCKLGNGNILANGTLLGGHVVMEDLVHTGGGAAVHQFCNIGSYAFLAGGTLVDRDVPMYMMAAGYRAELRGLNLEGMRRCGFSGLEIRSIRKAYQKLFMSRTTSGGLEERLCELEQDEDLACVPAVMLMLQSIRDCFGETRRGICKFRDWAST